MKEANIDLQKSSISVVHMLGSLNYISRRKHDELLHRIKTGERAAYTELRVLLIEFSDVLGRLD